MADLTPTDIGSALRIWALAGGCKLAGWRFVGRCIEARIDVGDDVELRILAPSLPELLDQLQHELKCHRTPRLRLVRGGRS
jgi:hypothetical protein